NDGSLSLKEWAIIEVQGELESSTGNSIGGKLIGHLIFSAKGRPILIIGYHILYGKITENNPPIAILKRSRFSNTAFNKESSADYVILALVKKKIIFRTRPKPIISLCH
ncbi:chromosome transmission fidelity protein 8 homolog, partial [Caerostris extrusa]